MVSGLPSRIRSHLIQCSLHLQFAIEIEVRNYVYEYSLCQQDIHRVQKRYVTLRTLIIIC